MKIKHWAIVIGVVALAGMVWTRSAATAQQRLVQRLLNSKECTGCDLSGANLSGLDLSGTNLQAANLQGANLQDTILKDAVLTDANLQNANLTDADLGCATVNFNLKADQETANINMTVDSADPKAIGQRDHILNFNFDADGQGATMSLNFGGCAAMDGVNLTGAKMPDGLVYQ